MFPDVIALITMQRHVASSKCVSDNFTDKVSHGYKFSDNLPSVPNYRLESRLRYWSCTCPSTCTLVIEFGTCEHRGQGKAKRRRVYVR